MLRVNSFKKILQKKSGKKNFVPEKTWRVKKNINSLFFFEKNGHEEFIVVKPRRGIISFVPYFYVHI